MKAHGKKNLDLLEWKLWKKLWTKKSQMVFVLVNPNRDLLRRHRRPRYFRRFLLFFRERRFNVHCQRAVAVWHATVLVRLHSLSHNYRDGAGTVDCQIVIKLELPVVHRRLFFVLILDGRTWMWFLQSVRAWIVHSLSHRPWRQRLFQNVVRVHLKMFFFFGR